METDKYSRIQTKWRRLVML